MTTIATDGKSMAGDGLVVSGDTVFDRDAVKVFRLTDGRIAGVAGSAFAAGAFVTWLAEGGDKPELPESFDALVLHPDGTIRNYNDKCASIIEKPPTATGSGREIAIGAMEAGASPEQAVEIASLRNTCTGGKITVFALERALRAA